MKTSALVLASILALSACAWTLFYFLADGEPLTPSETLVVVGVCAAGVLGARRIWAWIWRERGGHAEQSP